MKGNDSSLEKLKSLLKTLFQFDSADLDFGIYRIMNYKRKEIVDFIEKDLIQAVEKEFEKYKTQSGKEILEKIEEEKKKIETLEKDLDEKILKNGEVEEKFKDKPFAKEYLELKKQLEEIKITESVQNEVFNNLYNFFSRYYEDGDFISKRRYSSKNEKYAIPYSGEEVKLYWANFDQYYVKTGEVFKDYEFKLKGWRVTFRTIFADVEAGNTKGDRRYFVLEKNEPVKVDKDQKTCFIQFEYIPLTDSTSQQYVVKTKAGEEKKTGIKQDEINAILKDKILQQIEEMELRAFFAEIENEKTMLEKHLYKYTRKVTSDFFIHKNLKGFLERELDYFIKTEVIDLNNLEQRHITRAKVVEGIGKRIIEFLAQIEEFQKMLWEKKKFVLKTDYVITIDKIPEEFYNEILKNKAQLKEWEDLGFGKISKKEDLTEKKLPVDTKHFDNGFKEQLLEKLSEKGNLDELIDGILIKSENWQALNLLLEKYRKCIKCIYIDPPYNTGNDEFVYKDNYQHSCWISMIFDRLQQCKCLMSKVGVVGISIDDNEAQRLQMCLDELFGNNKVGELSVIRAEGGGLAKHIVKGHDYLLICAADISQFPPLLRPKDVRGPIIEWREKSYWIETDWLREEFGKYGTLFYEDIERVKGPEKKLEIDEGLREGRYRLISKDGKHIVGRLRPLDEDGSKFYSVVKYLNADGMNELFSLFGSCVYDYPKPVGLLQHYILGATFGSRFRNALVLDFFAGSGTTAHAVINLNRQDSGGRKYILVEMGDWFETVLLPRIKKVVFCEKWKDGKPDDGEGTSHMVKYHYLEQYEDALHNIEFPNEEKEQMILDLFGKSEEGNEYMMKYFLQYETEGSPSLMNLKQFENPFEYKLKIISGNKGEEIVNVDLIETFNYLIGLKVDKYKFLQENGRKYTLVLGERGNRKIAVVWRATKDIDLEKDKEIINKAIGDYNPDEVFINGDAFYKDYKVIETEFKALMGV